MVLHMRKIISVLIALIMLMSAAPVFAEEVQQTEEVLQTEGTLQTEKIQDEAEESEKAAEESREEVQDEFSESSSPESGKEEQKLTLEITLYDVDENKLEDKAAIQFDKGMTLEKVMELFNEERHYEISWEKCKYIINDIEEENIDIKEYKPGQGDSIEIRMTAEAVYGVPEQEEICEEEIQLAAVDPNKLENVYNDTQKTIADMGASFEWAFTSEWIVLGLARSGKLSEEDAKKYCDRIAAYLKNKNSEKLNSNISSDNSRLILALTSLGNNPTDINGFNLINPLADMEYIMKQGLSGPVWALIALDSHNYQIPDAGNNKNQTTRKGLVSAVLSKQFKEGGWAFSGTKSDVDMTCMVLQALAPYYMKGDNTVDSAVAKALAWLSSTQKADGSFTSSSESHSQVIVALTRLGIDPEKDARFVKGENSALDALMKFYVSDGGFKHVLENATLNSLATQQGYYALTAYYRFKNNMSPLFDMNDILMANFSGIANPKDDGGVSKPVSISGKAAGKTRSLGYLALGDGSADESLIKENFGVGDSKQDALSQEEAYNEYVKSIRLAKTLPWIYIAIGAVALIGIILLLRNRRTE